MTKLILVAGLLCGCHALAPGHDRAGSSEGNNLDASDPCQTEGPFEVGLQQSTVAGYTGEEVLDRALGVRELALEWSTGEITTLALEVVDPAPVAQLHTATEECGWGSTLTIDAFLELHTEDGGLQERVPVTVTPQQDVDHLHISVVLDSLAGALDPGAFVANGAPFPTKLAIAMHPDETCGWIVGQEPDSPAPDYEIGWFWTEATASEFGTGRDHFIGCYHSN